MIWLLLSLAWASPGSLDVASAPERHLPDPGAAAVLSATVGFGSGHFYARQPALGLPLLLAQAAGLGLAVAGTGMPASPPHPLVDCGGEGRSLVCAGSLLFAAARVVDVLAAPHSAHRTARMSRDGDDDRRLAIQAQLVLTRAELALGITPSREDRELTLRAVTRLLSGGVAVDSIVAAMREARRPEDVALHPVLVRAYRL